MVILLVLLMVLPACAELQAIDEGRMERDRQKHQAMVEKGARQIEEAERQAKARKEQKEHESRDRQAYYDWYNALPYGEKMKETRWQEEQQRMRQDREDKLREQEANRQAMLEAARAQERAAAMQALGMINMGRGIFGPPYAPPSPIFQSAPAPAYSPPPIQYQAPLPNLPVNCTSTRHGNLTHTNCY